MNMLIEELSAVAGHPLAWGAVAALGLFAVYSLWRQQRCPLLLHRPDVSQAEAQAMLERPVAEGPRFLVTMLAGVALTLTGLSFIAAGMLPIVAFYLLLAGVFVIQTEPARRQIREAEMRVIAAEVLSAEQREAAVERLASAHLWLVGLNFILTAGAVAALLAF